MYESQIMHEENVKLQKYLQSSISANPKFIRAVILD